MSETIELDISLEEYFTLNEAARKKNLLLDDYINNILREALDNDEFLESIKSEKK